MSRAGGPPTGSVFSDTPPIHTSTSHTAASVADSGSNGTPEMTSSSHRPAAGSAPALPAENKPERKTSSSALSSTSDAKAHYMPKNDGSDRAGTGKAVNVPEQPSPAALVTHIRTMWARYLDAYQQLQVPHLLSTNTSDGIKGAHDTTGEAGTDHAHIMKTADSLSKGLVQLNKICEDVSPNFLHASAAALCLSILEHFTSHRKPDSAEGSQPKPRTVNNVENELSVHTGVGEDGQAMSYFDLPRDMARTIFSCVVHILGVWAKRAPSLLRVRAVEHDPVLKRKLIVEFVRYFKQVCVAVPLALDIVCGHVISGGHTHVWWRFPEPPQYTRALVVGLLRLVLLSVPYSDKQAPVWQSVHDAMRNAHICTSLVLGPNRDGNDEGDGGGDCASASAVDGERVFVQFLELYVSAVLACKPTISQIMDSCRNILDLWWFAYEDEAVDVPWAHVLTVHQVTFQLVSAARAACPQEQLSPSANMLAVPSRGGKAVVVKAFIPGTRTEWSEEDMGGRKQAKDNEKNIRDHFLASFCRFVGELGVFMKQRFQCFLERTVRVPTRGMVILFAFSALLRAWVLVPVPSEGPVAAVDTSVHDVNKHETSMPVESSSNAKTHSARGAHTLLSSILSRCMSNLLRDAMLRFSVLCRGEPARNDSEGVGANEGGVWRFLCSTSQNHGVGTSEYGDEQLCASCLCKLAVVGSYEPVLFWKSCGRDGFEATLFALCRALDTTWVLDEVQRESFVAADDAKSAEQVRNANDYLAKWMGVYNKRDVLARVASVSRLIQGSTATESKTGGGVPGPAATSARSSVNGRISKQRSRTFSGQAVQLSTSLIATLPRLKQEDRLIALRRLHAFVTVTFLTWRAYHVKPARLRLSKSLTSSASSLLFCAVIFVLERFAVLLIDDLCGLEALSGHEAEATYAALQHGAEELCMIVDTIASVECGRVKFPTYDALVDLVAHCGAGMYRFKMDKNRRGLDDGTRIRVATAANGTGGSGDGDVDSDSDSEADDDKEWDSAMSDVARSFASSFMSELVRFYLYTGDRDRNKLCAPPSPVLASVRLRLLKSQEADEIDVNAYMPPPADAPLQVFKVGTGFLPPDAYVLSRHYCLLGMLPLWVSFCPASCAQQCLLPFAFRYVQAPIRSINARAHRVFVSCLAAMTRGEQGREKDVASGARSGSNDLLLMEHVRETIAMYVDIAAGMYPKVVRFETLVGALLSLASDVVRPDDPLMLYCVRALTKRANALCQVLLRQRSEPHIDAWETESRVHAQSKPVRSLLLLVFELSQVINLCMLPDVLLLVECVFSSICPDGGGRENSGRVSGVNPKCAATSRVSSGGLNAKKGTIGDSDQSEAPAKLHTVGDLSGIVRSALLHSLASGVYASISQHFDMYRRDTVISWYFSLVDRFGVDTSRLPPAPPNRKMLKFQRLTAGQTK